MPHVTLGNYFDAANSSKGNPSRDSLQEFSLDVWTIGQQISETSEGIEFVFSELIFQVNFHAVKLSSSCVRGMGAFTEVIFAIRIRRCLKESNPLIAVNQFVMVRR
ncbi:MAG: Phage minor tail protein [Solimicrobium sp.]|jgi:hypothetical protein|nr:Phage minor tail protein [Solimicrobium sp.]